MKPLSDPDWALIRVFLAVAEAGSLSAAAAVLGVSQPTLSRQVRAAEGVLGGPLFRRHARGLALTEAGAALVEEARAMKAAAARLGLAAAGQGAALKGTVRITASAAVSFHVLPDILTRLRVAEPEIELELHPNDTTENLLFREADIAVRMYRPEQLEVVTRHIGTFELGLFAARGYLERAGVPRSIDDLKTHAWIGLDRSEELIQGMARFGFDADRSFFGIRCDHLVTNWALLRAGGGVGVAPVVAGSARPDLVRLVPELDIPGLPVWLAAHEALRRTPRIRRVWDALADGLTQALAGG